ncbi:hypothetical protein VTJ04DRAFT_5876 [Mycothermus thermophilus]|uniref:uncharacterized protein n=1 Tax=Humicola insolens TaxID=85995 RepID=UPI003742392A
MFPGLVLLRKVKGSQALHLRLSQLFCIATLLLSSQKQRLYCTNSAKIPKRKKRPPCYQIEQVITRNLNNPSVPRAFFGFSGWHPRITSCLFPTPTFPRALSRPGTVLAMLPLLAQFRMYVFCVLTRRYVIQ